MTQIDICQWEKISSFYLITVLSNAVNGYHAFSRVDQTTQMYNAKPVMSQNVDYTAKSPHKKIRKKYTKTRKIALKISKIICQQNKKILLGKIIQNKKKILAIYDQQ